MSTTDRMSQVTGKAKEIIGRITRNRTLLAKGVMQQRTAKAKITLNRTARRTGDAVRHLAGRFAHR